MLVGRWMQLKAVEQNRDRLLKEEQTLQDLREEKSDEKISRESLQKGMRYRVLAGSAIPVKSIFLNSEGTLGMDWISGETEARLCKQGEIVPSGGLSIQKEPLLLEALESWDESL